MGQKTNSKTQDPSKTNTKNTDKSKRYATRFGQHYSIVRVPSVTEVINGIPVVKPGKTIEFKNGIYETSDPAEQEFLATSPYAGVDYMEVTKEVDSALKAKQLAEKEAELKAKEDDLRRRELEIQNQEDGGDAAENKNQSKTKNKQPKF